MFCVRMVIHLPLIERRHCGYIIPHADQDCCDVSKTCMYVVNRRLQLRLQNRAVSGLGRLVSETGACQASRSAIRDGLAVVCVALVAKTPGWGSHWLKRHRTRIVVEERRFFFEGLALGLPRCARDHDSPLTVLGEAFCFSMGFPDIWPCLLECYQHAVFDAAPSH